MYLALQIKECLMTKFFFKFLFVVSNMQLDLFYYNLVYNIITWRISIGDLCV